MTRTERTALLAGAASMGAVLLTRAFRAHRAISFEGRTVLITGGSRGLGLLVARQLGAERARLVLAARDRDELERAREELRATGADVATFVCDIGRREEADALISKVVARNGRIDVLINNAGVIKVGPLDHMDDRDFEEAMAIHFWGPLHTMRAAIAVMRRQGGGRLVNVSSIGGKIGVPHLTPYCASKFALAGLSASMRTELVRDGIYVTTVFPGLMRTGSPFNAWFKGRHREEFTWFALADSMPGLTVSGERAAAQLIDACRYGDAERLIGWPSKMAAVAGALMPSLCAQGFALANRWMLPAADPSAGTQAHIGWQSRSSWAPSPLTRLTERAAARNNEVPH